MTPHPHWKKLGPGVYVDDRDCVHVVSKEVCAHLGMPHTKENEDLITESCKMVCRENQIKAPVVEQFHKGDEH